MAIASSADIEYETVELLSPARLAVRRFLRHRVAVAALVVLGVIILASVFLPWFISYKPNAVDLLALQKPPGHGHLLGTDAAGRDVLARLLAGGRVRCSWA